MSSLIHLDDIETFDFVVSIWIEIFHLGLRLQKVLRTRLTELAKQSLVISSLQLYDWPDSMVPGSFLKDTLDLLASVIVASGRSVWAFAPRLNSLARN